MKQKLELRQKLKLTPQLQQAIRLLQMSSSELKEEILRAHGNNPLLEIIGEDDGLYEGADHPNGSVAHGGLDDDFTREDMQWRKAHPDVTLNVYHHAFENNGCDFDRPVSPSSIAEEQPSLPDSLAGQAIFAFPRERERRIARHIIQNINEAGYVEAPLEEIQQSLNVRHPAAITEIESVLKIIQTFEPAGVGARNPRESLLLQLDALFRGAPDYDMAKAVIRDNLELLAEKEFAKLRKILGVSDKTLQRIIGMIRSLNPHPGRGADSAFTSYIVPDILVEKKQGDWFARLNSGALPRIGIHGGYQKIIARGGAKEYGEMKEQLQRAKWLLGNIENRHRTILKIAREIVERQQDFFHLGAAEMRPLKLAQISESLGVHESTVSRATSGKYLSAPRGIYELKYFFSTDVGGPEGRPLSSLAVQSEIKRIIQAESSSNRVSDKKICSLLSQKGMVVARRTIAKYRAQLKIPSSGERGSIAGR